MRIAQQLFANTMRKCPIKGKICGYKYVKIFLIFALYTHTYLYFNQLTRAHICHCNYLASKYVRSIVQYSFE